MMALSAVVLLLQVGVSPEAKLPPAAVPQAVEQRTSSGPQEAGDVLNCGSLQKPKAPGNLFGPADKNRVVPAPALRDHSQEASTDHRASSPGESSDSQSCSSESPASPAFLLREAALARTKYPWYGLMAAAHGAAVFDAWSTRRVIRSGRGHELNPLLQPFARSGGLYVVVQAMPALADYVGHRMRMSRNPWARRLWWLPQAASAAGSFAAGVYNLRVYRRMAPGFPQ